MWPEAAVVFFVVLSGAFGLAYFQALNRLARGFVSPYAKADVTRRIGAAAIDAGLVVSCVAGYRTQGSLLFLVAAFLYLLLRDAVFVAGQSVGKFVMGLLVVNLDTGRPCSRADAVKRNLIFIIPGFNLIAVFLETATIIRDPQGQRLGDRLTNTQVVEGLGVKELVKALQKALEIEVERHREEQPVEVK